MVAPEPREAADWQAQALDQADPNGSAKRKDAAPGSSFTETCDKDEDAHSHERCRQCWQVFEELLDFTLWVSESANEDHLFDEEFQRQA